LFATIGFKPLRILAALSRVSRGWDFMRERNRITIVKRSRVRGTIIRIREMRKHVTTER